MEMTSTNNGKSKKEKVNTNKLRLVLGFFPSVLEQKKRL